MEVPTGELSSNGEQKIRVAVVGGGIGGVAFAAFISKLLKDTPNSRVQIDLYEACPTLTEIGAGVGMYLRTWKIMQSYGEALTASLMKISPSGRDFSKNEQLAFAYRTGFEYGTDGRSMVFWELRAKFGILALHRAGLQASIASQINEDGLVNIFFSKRLQEYTTQFLAGRSIIHMLFEDGTESTADVLIGADGIRSAVRNTLYKNLDRYSHSPTWTGTTVYRSLIKVDELSTAGHASSKSPTVFFGKNKHVLTFPIKTPNAKGGDPDVINLVAFCSKPEAEGSAFEGPWMRPVEREALLDEFKGWNKEVAELLAAATTVSLWAIHVLPTLPTYSKGNVCLLGDAAHAMPPHQGAGGGQAIEDAHVLAHLLAYPSISLDNITRALEVYDTVRRPIAEEVARRSRLNGMMYELNAAYEDESSGRSQEERLLDLGRSIEELHDWEWTSREAIRLPDGDQQVALALQMFAGKT